MNKHSKPFYEPNNSTAMTLSLRRTLVLSDFIAAILNLVEFLN